MCKGECAGHMSDVCSHTYARAHTRLHLETKSCACRHRQSGHGTRGSGGARALSSLARGDCQSRRLEGPCSAPTGAPFVSAWGRLRKPFKLFHVQKSQQGSQEPVCTCLGGRGKTAHPSPHSASSPRASLPWPLSPIATAFRPGFHCDSGRTLATTRFQIGAKARHQGRSV